MSIIIQTGHQSSHSDKFMQMLYEWGLGAPAQSHTHGLSANEIATKLAKIFTKNSSIINTKMMDNLILDLLLANLDQDDWGWADECNLDVLSYWQQADDNIRFILVFDSPKLLLTQMLDQNITPDVLDSAIKDWIAYHEKMLSFFESQSQYCLLIEGDLAINNLMNVKDYIQSITTNLKIKKNWQIQTTETQSQEDSTNPMFDIVVGEILKQYPDCLALYETLLEKSTIRLKNKNLPTTNTLTTLIQSFNLFNEQEVFKKQLLVENANLQNQLMTLMSEKQSLEQKLSQNVLLLEQSKTAVNAEQKAQIEKAEQENKLLITQLHQVQEELEKYYLQSQKTAEQLKAIEQQKQQLQTQADAKQKLEGELNSLKDAKQKAETLANEQKKQAEQTKKQLTDLQVDLQKLKQNEQSSKTAKQENELLISQLHQVQEELERYYLENQKLKSEQKKEPAKPVYYGAADRVKEDLPYRLGATMVSHSKSAKDLATLPLALAKEYREFQKHKPADNLPAIEDYQDAHEAEKVKKHLSYRLGKTLVDGVKSKKVLDLPVKLGREIVGFGNK